MSPDLEAKLIAILNGAPAGYAVLVQEYQRSALFGAIVCALFALVLAVTAIVIVRPLRKWVTSSEYFSEPRLGACVALGMTLAILFLFCLVAAVQSTSAALSPNYSMLRSLLR